MVENEPDGEGETAPRTAGWFAYEATELDTAARRVLGVADQVDDVAGRSPLGGAGRYGHGSLASEAATYESRFRHLHRGLADEIESAGYALRGTAETYDEVDAQAASTFAVDLDYLLTGKPSQ